MQQFNLEEWLQDKSRKIVTRDGRPVRIGFWDKENASSPIVFLIKDSEQDCSYEYINCANIEGKADSGLGSDDLFFADEEEELTEFERELQIIISEASYCTSDDGSISSYCQFGDKEIKKISVQILDLARKEIEKSIEDGAIKFAKSYMDDVNPSLEKVQEYEELWKWKMSCLRGINKAYTQGKQDALKDLPKWRNINLIQVQNHYAHIANGIISPSGYFISYDNLETLPKEE